MSLYFDTSIVVSLFVNDAFSGRAEAFIASQKPIPVVSDLTSTEFASVMSRRVRTGANSESEAKTAFLNFDGWLLAKAERVECSTFDLRRAELTLRRLDLPLRAPDAMHIAIAQRLGLAIATFDIRLAESASALGVAVAPA